MEFISKKNNVENFRQFQSIRDLLRRLVLNNSAHKIHNIVKTQLFYIDIAKLLLIR